uniref:Uncharacterized protein n=1 Tax=Oryza glumipatula TaxID=40148 RepID=A0A0D9YSW3_9ORYZ
MGPLPSPPGLPPLSSLSLPRLSSSPSSSSSSSTLPQISDLLLLLIQLARSLAAENPARAGWLVLELQSPAPSQAPYQPRYKLHTVY